MTKIYGYYPSVLSLCQIKQMDRNWCFCLFNIGLFHFINKLSLISNKNLASFSKNWNYQMRIHNYKTEDGDVLNS